MDFDQGDVGGEEVGDADFYIILYISTYIKQSNTFVISPE